MLRFLFRLLLVCTFPCAMLAQSTSRGACPPAEEGIVKLRVELLASGRVGEVTVIQGLPHGLTEEAVAAARKIKFKPKIVNGAPQTVVRLVEYTFSITSFDESSQELAAKARLIDVPKPHFSIDDVRAYGGQTIRVELMLESDGKANVLEIKGSHPQSAKKAVRKAASKIKFEPAIHRCGAKVPQSTSLTFEIR